jgi:hypothetical protein
MATILVFKTEERAAAGKPAADTGDTKRRPTAQILIFPGVRYERALGPTKGAEAPVLRQRDRLQIVE